jgi:hypothetical protein
MAPMYGGGGGGKAARATKKVAKAVDKAVKRMDSGKDSSKSIKRMAKAGATPSDIVSAVTKSSINRMISARDPLTGPFKQAVKQRKLKR